MSDTTVFVARDIITMNASRPHATHVAIRDGRIIGAGSAEDAESWGPFTLNEDFADKVLVPGFVEGHALELHFHILEGGLHVCGPVAVLLDHFLLLEARNGLILLPRSEHFRQE